MSCILIFFLCIFLFFYR